MKMLSSLLNGSSQIYIIADVLDLCEFIFKFNVCAYTHRFTLVPCRVEFLINFQTERGIASDIIHLIVHNSMRFWIQTLQMKNIS